MSTSVTSTPPGNPGVQEMNVRNKMQNEFNADVAEFNGETKQITTKTQPSSAPFDQHNTTTLFFWVGVALFFVYFLRS